MKIAIILSPSSTKKNCITMLLRVKSIRVVCTGDFCCDCLPPDTCN